MKIVSSWVYTNYVGIMELSFPLVTIYSIKMGISKMLPGLDWIRRDTITIPRPSILIRYRHLVDLIDTSRMRTWMRQNMSRVCVFSVLFIPPTAPRLIVKIFAMHGSRCHCIHSKGRLFYAASGAAFSVGRKVGVVWGVVGWDVAANGAPERAKGWNADTKDGGGKFRHGPYHRVGCRIYSVISLFSPLTDNGFRNSQR